MQDFEKTIVSQYANSATLVQLITNFNGYIDPGPLFDEFYDKIWNVLTAEGVGLDIWGRIVGVGRTLTITTPPTYFGYETGTTDFAPFNDAPFWNGTPVTQNFVLSDEAYRALILIKAATNIARTTSGTINRLLTQLFAGRGRAYVNSLGDMQMRFTFEFYLEPFELAILTQGNVLPRPTGVGVTLVEIPQGSTFGFNEAGDRAPFGEGTFLSQGAIHAV
jgi:hypothetical protein